MKRLLSSVERFDAPPQIGTPPRRRVKRQQTVAERLGPAKVSQLLNDYQGGMSIKDVAARYGAGKASVLKILKEHDVTTRPTGVNTMWLKDKHYRRKERKRGK